MDFSHTKADIRSFVQHTTRFQRYRYSGKTLRFSVYRFIEIYVAISLVALVATSWSGVGALRSTVLGNLWIIAVLGVAHHLKLVTTMPWLVMAAAFEGWLLWASYHWAVSKWLTIPDFYAYGIVFAVLRYWQRGERFVNITAYQACVTTDRTMSQRPAHDA